MSPFVVLMVARYSLVVSMVIAGAAVYLCTFAGGFSVGSTGPNVAAEQSPYGTSDTGVGEGLGVGVGTGVGVVTAIGVALLAALTAKAMATMAPSTTAADAISSGVLRVPGTRGSLIRSASALLVKPARCFTRVIRDHQVGASPANRAQRLQHRGALVEGSR